MEDRYLQIYFEEGYTKDEVEFFETIGLKQFELNPWKRYPKLTDSQMFKILQILLNNFLIIISKNKDLREFIFSEYLYQYRVKKISENIKNKVLEIIRSEKNEKD